MRRGLSIGTNLQTASANIVQISPKNIFLIENIVAENIYSCGEYVRSNIKCYLRQNLNQFEEDLHVSTFRFT